jgi:hypothetical protein
VRVYDGDQPVRGGAGRGREHRFERVAGVLRRTADIVRVEGVGGAFQCPEDVGAAGRRRADLTEELHEHREVLPEGVDRPVPLDQVQRPQPVRHLVTGGPLGSEVGGAVPGLGVDLRVGRRLDVEVDAVTAAHVQRDRGAFRFDAHERAAVRRPDETLCLEADLLGHEPEVDGQLDARVGSAAEPVRHRTHDVEPGGSPGLPAPPATDGERLVPLRPGDVERHGLVGNLPRGDGQRARPPNQVRFDAVVDEPRDAREDEGGIVVHEERAFPGAWSIRLRPA